jgi:hypothetical protein
MGADAIPALEIIAKKGYTLNERLKAIDFLGVFNNETVFNILSDIGELAKIIELNKQVFF